MSAESQRTCPSSGRLLTGTLSFCPVCLLGDMLAGEEAGSCGPSPEDTLEAPPGCPALRFKHYELLTAEGGEPIELGRGPDSLNIIFLPEVITKRKSAIEIGNNMKILMVLTSPDKLGNTGRKTGFWLEQFAAPERLAGAQFRLIHS